MIDVREMMLRNHNYIFCELCGEEYARCDKATLLKSIFTSEAPKGDYFFESNAVRSESVLIRVCPNCMTKIEDHINKLKIGGNMDGCV